MSFKMRLSPVDHIFTGRGGYPINFLLFFPGKIDPVRTRASLERAVELFTPFRSRLVASLDQGKTFEFQESSQGLGWNVQKSTALPAREDLHALTDMMKSAQGIPGESLLEVTLTHHAEGSALGVSGSHCVVDGYSYFMFLVAWSKLFRNETPVSPELDRNLLLSNAPLQDGIFDRARVFRDTGFAFCERLRPGDSSRVTWEVLDFSKAELESLYQVATSKTGVRLSLNDVLSAEIWRRFTRMHQKSGQRLSLACAFDYRRAHGNLSPFYFGNAVRGASFEADYAEVLESEPYELALRVNRAVQAIDARSVQDSLECLESLRRQEGLGAMERFQVADPDTGFLVTNLSRLPLLDLDFGTGTPTDFRILTPARHTAVVLPLRDGLRVQIAL